MLALAEYRADLHVCGQPMSESTARANEGRYKVPLPTRCFACDAIEMKQDEYKDAVRPRALLWSSELF